MGTMNGRRAPHCAIGRIIDVRLAERGWQQQDLAFVLNCSGAYVSAVITGRKRIAVAQARQLAIALSLNAYELLSEQNAEVLGTISSDPEEMAAIHRRIAEIDALSRKPALASTE